MGNKAECSNYKDTSLLSVSVKLYGRLGFERVVACTEHLTEEKCCDFEWLRMYGSNVCFP